jgi:Tfp pilus assembly PilM family ATPase
MALSLEIRSGFVYMVESKSKSKSGPISISKTLFFEFPESWIDNQGVREIDEFGSLLAQHLTKNNIREKDCILCINNASIIYRELIIPKIDDKKTPFIVRSEMMNALNLTPDYIMDFIVLEEIQREEDATQLRVLAVAMLESAIESYLQAFKKAKCNVVAIDSATNAIIKLANESKVFTDDDPVIIVDVGNSYLRLYLFENGMYVLSRNARLVSYSEGDKESVIPIVEDNINKMIQFSYTRSKKAVKKIVLMGVDEILPDIQKVLFDSLFVPCDIIQMPSTFVSTVGYQTKYVNAFGALIRK